LPQLLKKLFLLQVSYGVVIMSERFKSFAEEPYCARVTEDGRKQTLQAHTENASKLARIFAEVFGAGNLAETVALYHDCGKETSAFQKYLFSEEKQRKVRHSIYGAKHVYEKFFEVLPIAEMLANCIASHHGELRDYLSPEGDATLAREMSENLRDMLQSEDVGTDTESLLEELKTILVYRF